MQAIQRPPVEAVLIRCGRALARIFLLLAGAMCALGQPGAFDPSFQANLPPGLEPAAIAASADGSLIVLLRQRSAALGETHRVIRLQADGQIDPVFQPVDLDGVGKFDKLALGEHGSVYVAVRNPQSGSLDQGIRRIDGQGRIDDTFRVTDFGETTLQRFSRGLGGSLWVTGFQKDGKGGSAWLLTATGQVDRNFLDPSVFDGSHRSRVLVPLPDGGVLMAGFFREIGGQPRPGVACILPTGALSPAFAQTTYPKSDGDDGSLYGAAVLADGRFMVAGVFDELGGHRTWNVARFNQDGHIDPSFTAPLMDEGVDQLFVEPGGNVVLRGRFSRIGNTLCPGFARLEPDGRLDASFSVHSVMDKMMVEAVTMTPAGQLVFAGVLSGRNQRGPSIVRLQSANSEPEASPVIVTQPTGESRRVGGALRLEVVVRSFRATRFQWYHNSQTLIGATNSDLVIPDLHLEHCGAYHVEIVNPRGRTRSRIVQVAVQPTLAHAGYPDLSFHCDPAVSNNVVALDLRPDGRLLCVAADGLWRLMPGGERDRSFPNLACDISSIFVVQSQSDQSTWLGGNFLCLGGVKSVGVARLLVDDRVDPGFVSGLGPDSEVLGLAGLADGRVLVVGRLYKPVGTRQQRERYGILRLLLNGQIDSTFHGPEPDGPFINRIVASQHGRLLVSWRERMSAPSEGMKLLTGDGEVDAAHPINRQWGAGGVGAMVADADGSAWVAGWSSSADRPGVWAPLTHIQPDGAATDVSEPLNRPQNSAAKVIGIDPQGRILVAGNFVRRTGVGNNSFDPGFQGLPNNLVHAMAITPEGDIYIGGAFTEVAGVKRPRVARLYGKDRTEPFVMGPFLSDEGWSLGLETFEGWRYELESSQNPETSTWRSVAAIVGSGRIMTLTDPEPSRPHAFYRVRVEVPKLDAPSPH